MRDVCHLLKEGGANKKKVSKLENQLNILEEAIKGKITSVPGKQIATSAEQAPEAEKIKRTLGDKEKDVDMVEIDVDVKSEDLDEEAQIDPMHPKSAESLEKTLIVAFEGDLKGLLNAIKEEGHDLKKSLGWLLGRASPDNAPIEKFREGGLNEPDIEKNWEKGRAVMEKIEKGLVQMGLATEVEETDKNASYVKINEKNSPIGKAYEALLKSHNRVVDQIIAQENAQIQSPESNVEK